MTRYELYNRLWREPLTKVAPDLGLSKPTLLRLCRKYQIPVPGRGHWARVKSGQVVEPDPLPDGEDVVIEVIINTRAVKDVEALAASGAQNDGVRAGPSPVETSPPTYENGTIDRAGIKRLLALGLKDRQAAATSAYLLQMLVLADGLSASASQLIRSWVLSEIGDIHL